MTLLKKYLKKFNVNKENIKIISRNLKQKKLTNIYKGRKISLILKKIKMISKTLINLLVIQ